MGACLSLADENPRLELEQISVLMSMTPGLSWGHQRKLRSSFPELGLKILLRVMKRQTAMSKVSKLQDTLETAQE